MHDERLDFPTCLGYAAMTCLPSDTQQRARARAVGELVAPKCPQTSLAEVLTPQRGPSSRRGPHTAECCT